VLERERETHTNTHKYIHTSLSHRLTHTSRHSPALIKFTMQMKSSDDSHFKLIIKQQQNHKI